jgi:hypothetical protein
MRRNPVGEAENQVLENREIRLVQMMGGAPA